MFGQSCQEASGRPAFLVGLSGKGSPDQFYGRQPQLGEKQLDAGGVAGIGRSHAAPTSWTVLSHPPRAVIRPRQVLPIDQRDDRAVFLADLGRLAVDRS